MKTTIKQVAKLANVSTATVSKYLNGVKLKEKNEEAVKKAIEALDYKVNSFARGLRSHRSMTIGVLIPELSNLFATQIISEVENAIMHHGYSTIVCDYKSDPVLEKQKLHFLLNKMVDALVIVPTGISEYDILDINIPVVFVDQIISSDNTNCIYIDNQKAVFEACEYLIENGHRKIGILCGPQNIYTAKERTMGYIKAMQKHNIAINDNYIKVSTLDAASGCNMTDELLKSDITAIIATNNELTVGAVIALNKANINIPGDISFIGFDNKELAEAVKPRLSVIVQPIEEIGRKTAEILIGNLDGEFVDKSNIKLSAKLLKMDSVKNIFVP